MHIRVDHAEPKSEVQEKQVQWELIGTVAALLLPPELPMMTLLVFGG
jgi:hypothetical protein